MFAVRASRVTPTSTLLALALMFVAGGVACSEGSPTDSPVTPLTGLSEVAAQDSLGNLPPVVPASLVPGHFRGTVLGPSAPGAGNDSLETAPRVTGAVVTAFPVLSGAGLDAVLGDAAATVTTGADGKFTLPTLAGGQYVVTIDPPTSSPYGGVWVAAWTSATSHEHPWWIVLWAK